MVSTLWRRWANLVVLVLAAFAVLATSQPRWSVKHVQGGVVTLAAGQKAARFALSADSSHTLSLTLRFSPSFAAASTPGASIRAVVSARGLTHQEARMSDTAEGGAFETGRVEFYEVVRTQPSHVDFDVVVERLSGDQALSIAWDAEAVTGEKGDSTAPKRAYVRVVEAPVPGP